MNKAESNVKESAAPAGGRCGQPFEERVVCERCEDDLRQLAFLDARDAATAAYRNDIQAAKGDPNAMSVLKRFSRFLDWDAAAELFGEAAEKEGHAVGRSSRRSSANLANTELPDGDFPF